MEFAPHDNGIRDNLGQAVQGKDSEVNKLLHIKAIVQVHNEETLRINPLSVAEGVPIAVSAQVSEYVLYAFSYASEFGFGAVLCSEMGSKL
ncbi:unnamed protein product [Haemonchus placei]|uniref:Aldedh domain-containing protein n=1 Tax=Haemonchus placei TaxID=6290 RepID=A0A0N4WZV5_HAEPC|nr:unnamed protein product [Haemonchus placei]